MVVESSSAEIQQETVGNFEDDEDICHITWGVRERKMRDFGVNLRRIGSLEVSVVGLDGNNFGTDFFGAGCVHGDDHPDTLASANFSRTLDQQ